MKKQKKVLALVLCAVMLVASSVLATMAYLTAQTDVVKNTFTVGNVVIDLDEAKVDVYGDEVEGADRVKANEYKLIPGHNYTKDPIVYVEKGSEPAYVFVKVANGLEAIEADVKIAAQIEANDWIELADGVYYYKDAVDARDAEVQLPVFEQFTLAGNADIADYAQAEITIDAYAIQADGFADAAAAWAAAPTTW